MNINFSGKAQDENIAAESVGDRDSNGFFIITEETSDFEAPDPSLDQAERITQALEILMPL